MFRNEEAFFLGNKNDNEYCRIAEQGSGIERQLAMTLFRMN